MPNNRRFKGWGAVALAVVFGLVAFVSGTSAQFQHNPFFEHTVPLAHAHAAEVITIRLQAVAAFDDIPDGLLDETQKMLTREFPKLRGSLQNVAPGLATDLEEALETVLELARAGDKEALPGAIERADRLARAAYGALVPMELAEDPVFVAAVMAKLFVADDGVAEGYEDAAEGDIWEFSNGWAALQRVRQMWTVLKPMASEVQAFEIEDAMDRLGELLPSAMPVNLDGADPEAGEDPARQAVSTLEGVVNAFLYPERELANVASLVDALASEGRAAYVAGDRDLAVERVLLAEFYYKENLRRLFDLLAPDAHGQVMTAIRDIKADVDAAGENAFERLIDGVREAAAVLGM